MGNKVTIKKSEGNLSHHHFGNMAQIGADKV